ncbi:acyl-CoA thioesterase [Pseudomonas sp. N040]|uniref:acyl-CoA thioesterase n=1 Tax=Pseudomonas sp. N040 TaxID=2785325 RepID=UPI0018A267A5|nr:thioesterase family protein [Pseudomonas sp. N040]MBF7728940.1 acyl-CoA thioesterase [Pseudomonas sp. N040]MBW7012580.1 acyl-CoA thioesterase [Pseudomonas sp. N040]
MDFVTKRTILFGDCDPAGIIFTPRVGYFVVEAVQEYLTHLLGGSGLRQISRMGVMPPARALSIEFLSTMTWDDVIDIQVSHQPAGTSSFTFLLVARNAAGNVTFRASLTQVCVDPESRQPVPLPQALREALSAAQ